MINTVDKTSKTSIVIILLMLVLYFVSIIWINFHDALWYQMDVYTYAFEGQLMHDAKSCFPDGWIFGNQFHVISSPNLSALFYGYVHDSTTSLAIASSILTLLVLTVFFWSFKLFVNRSAISIGLFCIIGGIILGTSASSYISGLQVLYTMAAYYSPYLIVLLLSLGCWLRLKDKKSIPWFILIILIPLNFAMGMQSLREMLILIIPLLIMEGFEFFLRISKHTSPRQLIIDSKGLLFSFVLFLAELTGHFYMQSLRISSTPIIGDLQLDLSFNGLISNIWASTKNILRISGVAIAVDGMKYLPLSFCAMVVALVVMWSLTHIIKKRENNHLAKAIVFCCISLMCVYGVGCFLMRTRDIYYFIYWLLGALSMMYCYIVSPHKWKRVIVASLIVIGGINYCYSFFPCFSDYKYNAADLEKFTEALIQDSIKVIYVDATPIVAASSKGKIISQSFWLDERMDSGYPLTVFPSDKYLPAYDDNHYNGALICFSNYYLNYLPNAHEEFRNMLKSSLEHYDELILGNRRFIFFRPKGRVINPSFYEQYCVYD